MVERVTGYGKRSYDGPRILRRCLWSTQHLRSPRSFGVCCRVSFVHTPFEDSPVSTPLALVMLRMLTSTYWGLSVYVSLLVSVRNSRERVLCGDFTIVI